jgi:hypothetical protein
VSLPIWRLEWTTGFRRRRLFALNVLVPLLTERTAAGAAIDLLQLAPALVYILWVGLAEAAAWAMAIPTTLLALAAANLVGIWIAGIARSIAEGALFAAVVSLFLLHGSGVFRTPLPGSFGARLEVVLPYRSLHELLFAGAGGGPAPEAVDLGLPGALTLVVLILSWGLAGTLLERIGAA